MANAINTDGNDPSVLNYAVMCMQKGWEIICDLLGGTERMRECGTTYLPKHEMELEEDYACRKKLATLFPALEETINKLTGRAFAEPLKVSEDTPEWIAGSTTAEADAQSVRGIFDDMDMQGQNVQQFARMLFSGMLGRGHYLVLVDSTTASGAVRTQADQQAQNIRPYCIPVAPERVLGWRTDKNGKLTQLRVTFTESVDDGKFGTVTKNLIKVYTPGNVETFEKKIDANGKVEWSSVAIDTNTLKEIPMVCFYANRTGFLQSKPPLMELAYLNLKHYQQQSSLDSLVDVAMVPILALIGVEATEGKEEVTVGGKSALKLPKDGDAKYVEHTGAAITSGVTSLQEIKQQMRDAGAKLLEPGSGRAGSGASAAGAVKTATQSGEEAASENSALGTMVEDFQDAFKELMRVIGLWDSRGGGGEIEMQPNLDPTLNGKDVMDLLLSMANSAKLSTETLFSEGKKRGFIGEEITWDEEKLRIANEPDFLTPPPMPGRGATGATGPAPKPAPGATGA